ncbi:MAG: mechanosensitive ion channel family protein [Coriobacteriales bacterium]
MQTAETTAEAVTSAVPDIILSILFAVLIVAIGFICDRLVVRIFRKVFEHDGIPVIGAKLTSNLLRGFIWVVVVCVILQSIFKIDVNALIAALGVGGIALSLGLQDTISNLFGGVSVSAQRLIDVGDYIEVGGYSGFVEDFKWRHTVIRDDSDNTITIPNSVMNSSAIKVAPDYRYVEVPFFVRYEKAEDETLSSIAEKIYEPVRDAVAEATTLDKDPVVKFVASDAFGYSGVIYMCVDKKCLPSTVQNAALRALSELDLV